MSKEMLEAFRVLEEEFQFVMDRTFFLFFGLYMNRL